MINYASLRAVKPYCTNNCGACKFFVTPLSKSTPECVFTILGDNAVLAKGMTDCMLKNYKQGVYLDDKKRG